MPKDQDVIRRTGPMFGPGAIHRLRLPPSETRLHPLARELMAILPPGGSTWPVHKKEAFLKAAEAIFDLLYEDDAVTERLRADWQKRSMKMEA